MEVGIVSGKFQISTTKDMFNSSRVTQRQDAVCPSGGCTSESVSSHSAGVLIRTVHPGVGDLEARAPPVTPQPFQGQKPHQVSLGSSGE